LLIICCFIIIIVSGSRIDDKNIVTLEGGLMIKHNDLGSRIDDNNFASRSWIDENNALLNGS